MTSMNDPVRVKLSEHDLAERAGIMATKLEHVRVLRRKKADDAKSTQALIDTELDELAAMARVILECEEDAKQGELFVDGTLSGLSQGIAERCSCEGGPDADVKSPACKLHGVESTRPAEDEVMTKCDGNHTLATPCEDPECWQIAADQPKLSAACDRWHVGSRCADPECWLITKPADDGAELAADYVVPGEVEVGTVEEPAAVAEFREAKKRRRSREASA